jgi:hypothetical protein
MTMKKQPEGIKRRAVGDEKPADQYEILLDGVGLTGSTERDGHKWQIHPAKGKRKTAKAWPDSFSTHGDAVVALLGIHRGEAPPAPEETAKLEAEVAAPAG